MSKKGYSYSFKFFMEGVSIPFRSAAIVCTPNGVEMNINVFPNNEVLEIKPKTAGQVFYREWDSNEKAVPWRLMGEGFFSSFYTTDQATEGRGIGLIFRDFRMDIRRAPAALAWEKARDLTTQTFYNSMGLFQTFVVPGVTKGVGTKIRIFDSTGLAPLSYSLNLIAGTAGYGKKKGNKNKQSTPQDTVTTSPTITGEQASVSGFGGVSDTIAAKSRASAKKAENQKEAYVQKNGQDAYTNEFVVPVKDGKAECGFYLDAIIRGMWAEAVGGTSVGAFLNKRILVNKRFLIPVNRSGYNFWARQKASVHIGSHLMGNARFSSLEAAIMRLAGAFSTRVYSCSTPSLIKIGDNADGSIPSSVQYTIDESVRRFIMDEMSDEYGAKYTLNSSMLLPPLEFTAPPNCNLMFPPMYDRVEWRYDIDADATRGYFSQTHMLSTKGGNALASPTIQVPNALFNIQKGAKSKDKYGRRKPPLTLEERYKGVNVVFGKVSYELAANDATKVIRERQLRSKGVKAYTDEIEMLKRMKSDVEEKGASIDGSESYARFSEGYGKFTGMGEINDVDSINRKIKLKQVERKKLKDKSFPQRTSNALKHHAVLKYLNSKYQGRVLSIDGAFNPYVMCGFPGAVIADKLGRGQESMKTVIGMVQQVKHTIFITPANAEANTSVVMNNVRFEDEPTDMDEHGSPLYMKATVPEDAEINIGSFEYWVRDDGSKYYIPEPRAPVEIEVKSKYYDLNDKSQLYKEYRYAKDLLSLTLGDINNGERNQIYIDDIYEPAKVGKFYRDVFGHNWDSFMVGYQFDTRPGVEEGELMYFAYDTIHEALVELRRKRPDLLTDYGAALSYVRRNVCSADAYFQGILGLSIKITGNDDKGKTIEKFTNIENNFEDGRIYDRYYGVTTDLWNSGKVDGLKTSKAGKDLDEVPDGAMSGPGEFSSIREHMPITAFIQERRDAVERYFDKAKRQAVSVSYQEKY